MLEPIDKDKYLPGNIYNIKELNIFLNNLFILPPGWKDTYHKDVEWAEIENGKKIRLTISFWSGSFNECPIIFKYTTSYSRLIDKNHLLMAILGVLTKNQSYYIVLDKKTIKIRKNIEMQ